MSAPFECKIAKFPELNGRDMIALHLDIAGMVQEIETTTAPTKEQLPMWVLAICGSLRSPAGSYRHAANVLEITGAPGDHDSGQMPFAEAVARLKASGITFIIYTTPSHQPGKPRWRVFVPFSCPLSPLQLAKMVARLNGILGGVLAPESFVLSQCWRIGRVDGVPFQIAFEDTEEYIDECDELDAGAIGSQSGQGARGKPDFKKLDEIGLRRLIETCQNFNGAAQELLWRWARAQVSKDDAEANLFAVFDAVPQALRNAKYHQRRAQIPRWTARVYAKLSKKLSGPFGAIVTYIEESPDWQGAIRLNRLTETIEVGEPFPPEEGQQAVADYRPLREPRDLLETMLALQKRGLDARKTPVFDALILVAERRSYHPVRDWLLGGLPQWDSEKRLSRLFINYFPGELPAETEADRAVKRPGSPLTPRQQLIRYYKAIGHNFMIAGVARQMQPGCKHDHLPVIVSPQGWLKSLGLASLMPVPAWFLEDLSVNLGNKEVSEALIGKWLVELPEVPHLRREVERVKAFFSRSTDRFRRPYDRLSADWPRTCFFCGTSNDLEFIDVTGNRRYWPVKLARPVEVEKIITDRDQLWAEALYYYQRGDQWWLTAEIEAVAAQQQARFVDEDSWDEAIAYFLRTDARRNPARIYHSRLPKDVLAKASHLDPDIEPLTLHEVIEALPKWCRDPEKEGQRISKQDELRAARCMKRLGWEKFRDSDHRGPVLWRPAAK